MLKLHNYEGVKPITKYSTSSNMKCSILLSFAIYLKSYWKDWVLVQWTPTCAGVGQTFIAYLYKILSVV